MKVVVTRPQDESGRLVAELEALGHEVVLSPLIEIEPLGPDSVDVAPYDWVVVTSRTGARELARRLRATPRRLAAVGPGTAETLREHGLEPDLVPSVSTQEGLLAQFPRGPGRVLFASAEGARPLLPAELGADVLILYRTRPRSPANFPDGDLVVLASASAARAYAALGRRIPAVSIGPETTRAARAAGVEVAAEATRHDLEGLVAAVAVAAAR